MFFDTWVLKPIFTINWQKVFFFNSWDLSSHAWFGWAVHYLQENAFKESSCWKMLLKNLVVASWHDLARWFRSGHIPLKVPKVEFDFDVRLSNVKDLIWLWCMCWNVKNQTLKVRLGLGRSHLHAIIRHHYFQIWCLVLMYQGIKVKN